VGRGFGCSGGDREGMQSCGCSCGKSADGGLRQGWGGHSRRVREHGRDQAIGRAKGSAPVAVLGDGDY